MATNFPASLDSYATKTDNITDVLAAHVNDMQDAIEALEAKVGIDNSDETTSHDYMVAHLIPSGTVMLFGQSTAPTGWTKKTNWANNSMIMYTTGSISSGGSDNPHSWTTAIVTQSAGAHTHTGPSHAHTTGSHTLTVDEIPSHRHSVTTIKSGSVGVSASGILHDTVLHNSPQTDYTNYEGGSQAHNHGDTGAAGTGSTSSNGVHTHGITQDTFAPKYQTVIAATKN